LDCYNAIESSISEYRQSGVQPLFLKGWEVKMEESNSEEEEKDKDKGEEYTDFMKPLQFDYFKLYVDPCGDYSHHYRREISNSYSTSKERILRLAQETGALPTSLPLNDSSSVFVRVDEDRIDVMSALITGPSDTPYSNGCFVFDIFFPDEYPDGPPHVWLKTTGNNSFRFNPNLYDTGKVCLSLLGTWQGAQGESWNRDSSTFLQVLVSIQSLILVPDPYFNEPGYERDIGTIHGNLASRNYNNEIRRGCVMYAMLEQLRNPPPGFGEIIKNHFRMRKKAIRKDLKKWKAEGLVSDSIQQLEEEFKKL